jgi:hypothetical protein
MKNKVLQKIVDHYANSTDYNGIPLTKLADELEIDYLNLLSLISTLIEEDDVSIQGGINPHIIRDGHYEKDVQLRLLEEAKNNKATTFATFTFPTDPSNPERANETTTTELVYESHLLCAYPSLEYLKNNSVANSELFPITNYLRLGDAQLKPLFFEIDVLERYFNDPRYLFEFGDYSGHISVSDPEDNPTTLKKSDIVVLQSFGLGYDEFDNRVVVAFPRDLAHLSSEHQIYWNSKLIASPCKMVKEYRDNIDGSWNFSLSLFSAVIEEIGVINEMTEKIKGKKLFRETFEEDNKPKEFTFFTSPTLVNYESFIGLLDKMISENINKSFFKGEVEEFELIPISEGIVEKKQKGTIRLLEEWLKLKYKVQDESEIDELLQSFKEVRKERQKPAHKISENIYDSKFFRMQMVILEKVYITLKRLRMIFHTHPDAMEVEIPELLLQGKIRKF